MEKEIAWTAIAQNDFWEIVNYLKAEWPETVLNHFEQTLIKKTTILRKQPFIGFKSHKHSRFRKHS